ncbi:MAG: HNH endonuclease signature motif containing protein [bacterium]
MESYADKPDAKKPTHRSRHIPAKTRDAVFIRDEGRCTHVGTNGKRCKATRWLQIDHIVPYAKGGTHAMSNLRLLCAKHNILEATRAYGAAKIDGHRGRV